MWCVSVYFVSYSVHKSVWGVSVDLFSHSVHKSVWGVSFICLDIVHTSQCGVFHLSV